MTDVITPLNDELDAARLEAQALKGTIGILRSDIEKIGQALIEEASNRGWCSEYDKFIEEVNRTISYPLPTRTREYVVTVPITVLVHVRVEATDEDHAIDVAAAAHLSAYDVTEAVAMAQWDTDWDHAHVEPVE